MKYAVNNGEFSVIPKSIVVVLMLCVCLTTNEVVEAQGAELNWAEKMFSDLKVDFGTVARGADTRHQIVLENLYEEDVIILDVDTTCGCTAASPDKTMLKTGEKARIDVVMDTRKFMHRKDSNVDVTLEFRGAKGASTKKIRVPITAYIRSDVVLTPGNVDFGVVDFGQASERTIKVAYAGRENWQIRSIKNDTKILKAQIVETERSNGRVSYNLTVQLDGNSGIGTFQEKLYLVTDDQNSPEVPVPVTGRIAPDIEIVPGQFALGNVSAGDVKPFNVVIKGRKPFVIESIECEKHPESFEIRPLADEAKTVHVIPFRFTAPEEVGEFADIFTVTVAGREGTLSFGASGVVGSGT